jgi:hypothetical protein
MRIFLSLFLRQPTVRRMGLLQLINHLKITDQH